MLCPSVCRPSVCHLSVCNVYVVANRYVLSKNCLIKQIGLSDRYTVVPIRIPLRPPLPSNGVLNAPPNICIANCGETASVSGMVATDSLWELTNALSNGTIADPLRTPVLQNRGPDPQNLHGKYLGASLEVYVILQLMQVSKELYSHLLAFGRRQLRSALAVATAGLLYTGWSKKTGPLYIFQNI